VFTQFLQDQGFSYLPIPGHYRNRQGFLVYTEGREELAKVLLSHKHGFYLTAKEGPLKACLTSWCAQYNHHLSDCSELDALEELETARSQLPPPNCPLPSLDGKSVSSSFMIRLSRTDHPIVELAELLGYTIFLTRSTAPPYHPRYHIMTQSHALAAQGEHLVRTLAGLLLQSPQPCQTKTTEEQTV
jgi:hypothetical protein